jgi:hypothetical protein
MPDRQMLMLWQRIHGLCGVRRKIKMDRSFIGNLNEVEIRHAKKGCMCKVCDRELNDDIVVYMGNYIIYAFLVGGRLTH